MENVKLCRGKSYPTRNANPKLSRGDIFSWLKTILVSCKETLNCNRYMYIVSSATLLCLSPTSYIAYIPIYNRDKQWIGQMPNSTHKQCNIAEIINMNWNGCISCTLPKFYRKFTLCVPPAIILLIYWRTVTLSTKAFSAKTWGKGGKGLIFRYRKPNFLFYTQPSSDWYVRLSFPCLVVSPKSKVNR